MVEIREACIGDRGGIARALDEAWKETLYGDNFERHVSSPNCSLLVSVDELGLSGFVSTFLSPPPTSSWEIDLLVVRPEKQGRGIGTALIQAAVQAAPEAIRCARASIRVDNRASQQAFSKAGFSSDLTERTLVLWGPRSDRCSPESEGGFCLVPVDTLTYRGLWIEAPDGQFDSSDLDAAIRCARSRIARERRANTGVALTRDQLKRFSGQLGDGRQHGEYHRWRLPAGQLGRVPNQRVLQKARTD